MSKRPGREIDMLNGPILSKILLFSLPLAATGILQLLFNAADVIVVGKFAGSQSLAAVGSTGALVNLIVGAFMGISVGANILVARYLGCRQHGNVKTAVHTAFALSAILSVVVTILGLVLAEPMLRWMDTPTGILPLATLYLRIYFLGIPAGLTYNFGAAILRAIGDTRRPMWYLVISGVVNVVLNLVLVIVFHLDVAGVAIATITSQYISLFLVVRCLCRLDGPCKLTLKDIRFHGTEALNMIQIGLPVGLQSVVFSLSNVIIQSTVNSFGDAVIAANAAAGNISGFTYTGMNAVSHASITFTSQNLGAGKLDRVGKIYRNSVITLLAIGIPLSIIPWLLGEPLLNFYLDPTEPEYQQILRFGMERLLWINVPHFLGGLMEVCCGMVRGLGKTWMPMFVTAFGACALRLLWIAFVFPLQPTTVCLYISYPISWALTTIFHILCYIPVIKQAKLKLSAPV